MKNGRLATHLVSSLSKFQETKLSGVPKLFRKRLAFCTVVRKPMVLHLMYNYYQPIKTTVSYLVRHFT